MKTCPWIDPEFELPPDAPCPVCGAYGDKPEEIEEKCVDKGPDFE